MKKIWYSFVQLYMKIGLQFFYNKIIVEGKSNIPKDKPILFVANHPNALVDPLLIGTTSPRELYFLTRSGVFKNKLIKKILASVNMLPIYRMRDGINTVGQNEAIFKKCYQVFKFRKTVLIFAEGSHSLVRRIRPLSKGFTRIAFGALEENPHLDLVIVPIGINYSKPTNYASKVRILFGHTIEVKKYINTDKNKATIALKKEVQQALQNLATHIENSTHYHQIVNQFDDEDFLYPEKVNSLLANNSAASIGKKTYKRQNGDLVNFLFKCNSFLTLIFWQYLSKKIKEKEFIATFKLALGITITPLSYAIQSLILGLIFNKYYALTYLILSIVLAYVNVKKKY